MGWSKRVAARAGRALQVLFWLLGIGVAATCTAQTQVLQLREALRVGAAGAAQKVDLPDAFERRSGDPDVLRARYLLHADLGAAPGLSAIYLPGVFAAARIAVNGHVVADHLDDAQLARRGAADRLLLATVPGEMLRPGLNAIEITLASRQGIGLSTVWVGDERVLSEMHAHKLLWQVDGPAGAAGVVMVLSLCVLVLWARQPGQTLYGYFGLGGMLWALHTMWRLLPDPLLAPPHLGIWRNLGFGFFVVPLVVFCLRLAEWRLPRFERLMWLVLAASPLLLYGAQHFDALGSASSYLRLLWIASVAIGVVAVGLYAAKRRDAQGVLLLLTGVIALAFGVHDWLLDRDSPDNNPIFLTSFAGLLFFPLVAWILIDGFVKAARELERLNVELEQRVADKSAQLRLALDDMRAAKDVAEAANRAKSTFLAAASHDLRQPTHALGLYLAALRAEGDGEQRTELVDRMSESIHALDTMFSALLDVSRMDAGAVRVETKPFAVAPLLHRLAHEFAWTAEAKGLRLSVRIGRHPQGLHAASDPVLVECIVRNLLGNAVKHTESGGVLLACRWRRGVGDGHWRIEVWDTGPGIPADARERVFEEFFQLRDRGHDRSAGLGLGLSIVKRTAQLLGHPLLLDSIPGKGSRFAVELPATTAPVTAPAELQAQGSLAGVAVGLVEDDAEVREATCALLERWGCRVSAGDSADALLARLAEQPGVLLRALIVDYELAGGVNGSDAIAQVRRACGSQLPALVVSGASAPDRLLELQASGNDWMIKPVQAARLRSWLVQATRSRAALRDVVAAAKVPRAAADDGQGLAPAAS
jgi:signal transduction histidine kinase/CheY-like chemotaxis protein